MYKLPLKKTALGLILQKAPVFHFNLRRMKNIFCKTKNLATLTQDLRSQLQ